MSELSDHARETTLRVARAMYPHDALPDEAYEKVVRQIEAEARGNDALATTIEQGIAELDESTPFEELEADDQLAALLRVEGGDYFDLVRATAVVELYDNHDGMDAVNALDWPISLAEVEPHYERTEAKIGLTGTNGIPQLPANNNYKSSPTARRASATSAFTPGAMPSIPCRVTGALRRSRTASPSRAPRTARAGRRSTPRSPRRRPRASATCGPRRTSSASRPTSRASPPA